MVPDRDASAGSDKAFGDRAPKPLRTAGDDGAAAVQINLVHRRFLGPNRIVLAVIPGCAERRRPGISRFRVRSLHSRPGMTSQRPSAVDDMRNAGSEGALVTSKINCKRSDLFCRAEPSHRLPRHEHLAPTGTRG